MVKYSSKCGKSAHFSWKMHFSLSQEITRELFELLFDEELLELVEKQSNLYANQKNIANDQITNKELKFFFQYLISVWIQQWYK